MKTAIKERGILMHARSVLNILAGRKTQTRRGDKRRLGDNVVAVEPVPDLPGMFFVTYRYPDGREGVFVETIKCPYGQPGDRLWVRETWGFHSGGAIVTGEDARPNAWNKEGFGGKGCWSPVVHKAGTENFAWGMYGPPKWRPSLFMPRSASRITLEIVSVRVERVQDISEADCRAEGAHGGNGSIPAYIYSATPREHFKWLWDDTNGKGAWERNDWCWCIDFKRVEAANA